ncbi:MAG TPA: hypothetical protein VGM14_11365 [Streptosporangiaceae bacterium]
MALSHVRRPSLPVVVERWQSVQDARQLVTRQQLEAQAGDPARLSSIVTTITTPVAAAKNATTMEAGLPGAANPASTLRNPPERTHRRATAGRASLLARARAG